MDELKTSEGSADAPLLTILVVSYNTRDMTLACLDSVQAQTRETDYELIVFDNASTDGSADAIAARFPAARLIRSPGNLGFARANNVAAREARGRLLLLLNPDTVILDGAIDKLVAFSRRRPEALIWGGRTLFGDGSVNRTSCFRQISLWSLACRAAGLSVLFPASEIFNAQAYGRWDRDTERAVEVVTGCFLLLPLELWRRLDGFDLSFVMYAEEADLCLRAARLGARPRVTPEAEIIHYGGASETVRADKMVKLLQGTVALVRKHWRWPARPIGCWLLRMIVWTRHVAATARGRGGEWSALWRRRGEWRNGYALHGPGLQGTGLQGTGGPS